MASPNETRPRRRVDVLLTWNRRSHYFLGLYFLFFLWLFAFTGLLLNHSWSFAEFWLNRKVSTFERRVDVPQAGADLDRARTLMLQLGIDGEIEWTATPPDAASFTFRVSRPGRNYQVTAPPGAGLAKVEQTDLNAWGAMRILHTFTGVRAADPRNARDWILTTLWVFAMDAVSAAMILMALGGIIMWTRLPSKRAGGVVALLIGSMICGLLVFGLRWILSRV